MMMMMMMNEKGVWLIRRAVLVQWTEDGRDWRESMRETTQGRKRREMQRGGELSKAWIKYLKYYPHDQRQYGRMWRKKIVSETWVRK